MHRSALLGVLAIGAVACTAGTGSIIPTDGVDREPPTTSNEPGAHGPDPGSTYEDPTGRCPACNETYACIVTAENETLSTEVPLIEGNDLAGQAACLLQGRADAVFTCSGVIVISVQAQPGGGGTGVIGAPTPVVTTLVPWTSYGSGGFAATFNGESAKCLPEKPYEPPVSVPGAPVDAGTNHQTGG